MGFQVSPGVEFSEIDTTGIIPSISTTDGAYAGVFPWGPLLDIELVGNEAVLLKKFGKPKKTENELEDRAHAISFFTCLNFLAYGDKLRVVRAADISSVVARTFTVDSVDLVNNKITFVVDPNENPNGLGSATDGETGARLPAVERLDKLIHGVPGFESLIVMEAESSTGTTLIDRLEFRPGTKIPTTVDSSGNTVSAIEEGDEVVINCYNGARNASADKKGALIKNDADYQNNFEQGEANVGPFVARYPGERGNSIRVAICASESAFYSQLAGAYTTVTNDPEWIQATSSAFKDVLNIYSVVRHATTGEEKIVVAISSTENKFKVDSPFSNPLSSTVLINKWEFYPIANAPTTSTYASNRGAKSDQMHIVVVDENGEFTGIPGSILERFTYLSKAVDAKTEDGDSNYYKDVINRKSDYIRWTDHPFFDQTIPTGHLDFGKAVLRGKTFFSPTRPLSIDLGGGVNGSTSAGVEGAREDAYLQFADPDKVDVSLVMMGEASPSEVSRVIQNVAEKRRDCVVFFSPRQSDVVGVPGKEAENVIKFAQAIPSSSYAFMDSGWKLQFDKFTNMRRWMPLNGDTAGLCARTDTQRDPWWSPAGYTRGIIKNSEKLAWSPYKAERDDLYLARVNPVISEPGQGTLLYGDKTMLGQPSAFDRLNVRRLFIVLEKAISRQAKMLLFEFNDEFTRQQFRSMVEPYLRDIQSRRGMYDFRVVCDRTNNTPEVIDRNEFVGDIYIKPARSINFIQLNFIAVRTGVEFSEIVGKI